jgi:hypothetical protein
MTIVEIPERETLTLICLEALNPRRAPGFRALARMPKKPALCYRLRENISVQKFLLLG